MEYPLTVYKASAGSGKTFTLATEYICLLLHNPLDYKKILAVTFTVKATAEMKSRIVSQLYGIWRGLSGSRSYMEKVCERLSLRPDQAAERAGKALHYILHDYSHFRVDTIDSFFLAILRNMARELDLNANLMVELEEEDVIDEAVDATIDAFSEGSPALKWVIEMVNAQLDESKTWNVLPSIKALAHVLTDDDYQESSKVLYLKAEGAPDFFPKVKARLRKIKAEAVDRLRGLAEEFFTMIEAHGLSPADFSQGAGAPVKFFEKLRDPDFSKDIVTATARQYVCNPASWHVKKAKRGEEVERLVSGGLGALYCRTLDEVEAQTRSYRSAEAILKNIYQLALLHLIDGKLRRMNEEGRRIFLSDTQQLLSAMLQEGDAPFVFEKIGGRLEHIMIDEFQDTSKTQWKNFLTLLNEVMSHRGCSNLIVGDVKQSIYRFRGGDSSMLMNISHQFSNPKEMLRIQGLDTNYRSSRGVVDFNNAFFPLAAAEEQVDGYDDVTQKQPAGVAAGGQVSVTLLPKDDYEDATLRLLLQQINEALAKGATMEQMAILTRSNRGLRLFAQYVAAHQPSLRLISDEAYRLDASPAVNVVVGALRLLLFPDDAITRAFLSPLPEAFQPERLLGLPLSDLLEELCRMFAVEAIAGQAPYLCTFFDQVALYLSDHVPSLPAFLNYWDNTLSHRTIQTPRQNGIRMLTIHKAKGLEFPHVFCPFFDWKMEKPDVVWFKPGVAPFNELPITPVSFSKQLEKTIFKEDYQREHRLNMADNLNMVYVAFTRPSCNLYVIGKRGSDAQRRSALLEKLLPQVATSLKGASLTGEENPEEALQFTAGAFILPKQREGGVEPNVFLRTEEDEPFNLHFYHPRVVYRQGMEAQLFTATEDEGEALRREYIKKGRVLHRVLQAIVTPDDLTPVLNQMEAEGVFSPLGFTRDDAEALLRPRLNDARVRPWFSPHWTLFNECAILTTDPATGRAIRRRPDRVMTDGKRWIVVDFKFGNLRPAYFNQVREYMQLISQLDDFANSQVEGWLWNVYSGETLRIKN